MTNIFQPVVEKLIDLGFYEFFFPWLITAAIFFGLLKKSKVLGEGVVLNGVVALSIAFLIFGFPVISGFSLALPISSFFTQATAIILFIFMGLLLASMFVPDLRDFLGKAFTRRTILWEMLALGLTLFITSTLISVFWFQAGKPTQPGAPPAPPTDIITIATGVIIFVVLLIIASAVVMGGRG